MILYLAFQVIHNILLGFLQALPQWNFSITSNTYIMMVVRYIQFLNNYLAIDQAIVALGLLGVIYNFMLGRKILVFVINVIRGAGA